MPAQAGFIAYPWNRQFVPPEKYNFLRLFFSFFCGIRCIFSVSIWPLQNYLLASSATAFICGIADLCDELLMQEMRAGNTDAFAVIFKRYHRLVHVTALNIVRDAGEAEDLTQTVFLEIYRRMGQYDPARGTLKVWLLQYAYSRSMHRRNYLFVRQFHKQIEFSEREEKKNLWSPTRLQFQETARLTSEVLSALPQAQRQTLEMFFFEGLTLKEIAQRRNESFSNVRHHYYRGLERLRSIWKTVCTRKVQDLPLCGWEKRDVLKHEQYRELCAAASIGEATPEELFELEQHTSECEACSQAYFDYLNLAAHQFAAADRKPSLSPTRLSGPLTPNFSLDVSLSSQSGKASNSQAMWPEVRRLTPSSHPSPRRLSWPTSARAIAALVFMGLSLSVGYFYGKGSFIRTRPNLQTASRNPRLSSTSKLPN